MISQVSGRLVTKDLDHVEVATSGGVAYDIAVPLGTFEVLPRSGETVSLYTHLVVRDDTWALFGFATDLERRVFRRLLGAKGVGPALALGMLSRYAADRLVRIIRDRDVASLQAVPRMGRKKAQQLVLDLAERLDDLLGAPGAAMGGTPAADDAIRALVSLGYGPSDAEKAVAAALKAAEGTPTVPDVIRAALGTLGKQ
jgi:holliday junction DNA helicase RuvA